MRHNLIITIDGPAGAGKSTVGRMLAQALGYRYLDSGALYRAVAWEVLRTAPDQDDPGRMEVLLREFHPQVAVDTEGFHLWVEGRQITSELRSPEVSQAASRVAKLPAVRQWVNDQLLLLAAGGGVVAEGRDLGTVVFSKASSKFYLDASLETRAARRRLDWQQGGGVPGLDRVKAEIAARDRQDATRAEAPLRIPSDAIVIDTTEMLPEEVVIQCLASLRIPGSWPDGTYTK